MIDVFTHLIYIVCFIGLSVASITDLKTREVPDYLSFTFIGVGIGFGAIASLVLWDPLYVLSSLLGFGLCFLFACVMFYTGQWGGGDAKMLMGVGALVGLPLSFVMSLTTFSSLDSIPFVIVFIPLLLIVGGIYGFIWMLVLLLVHRNMFMKKYKEALAQKKNKRIRNIMFVFVGFCFVVGFFSSDIFMRLLGMMLGVLVFILYYSFLYIKIVEKIALIKKIPIDLLTEGDWVAHDVVVDSKIIVSKKDLGVSAEQLALLRALVKKKKIDHVVVRYGIPFLPSFLLAFVVCAGLFQYVL